MADSLDLMYYPWDSLCSGSIKMGPEQQDITAPSQLSMLDEDMYRLIPNFFGDDKTGKVTLHIDEQGSLKIYSIDGRLVGDYSLTEGQNTINLSKALAQNGVYIYKIFVNGQLRKTDKLVAVK